MLVPDIPTIIHVALYIIVFLAVSSTVHVFQVDERGKHKKEFRCKHTNFVLKTEVPGEMEFLYSPYSLFKVSAL